MDVHLVDGTYELFRYHFAPNNKDLDRGATVGVVRSCLQLIADGATHVGVACDHVIESFRNDLWPGYKTSAGMDRQLLAQFGPVEDALRAAGFTVWPMVEVEADDALASAAHLAAADARVDRAIICTPDKDLGQCVVDGKVWQWDRRQDKWFDVAGVRERLGVAPESVPDLLALIGDSADGFPGLPGWGGKSAAAVLARWGHLEDIPAEPLEWDANVRGASKLNLTLRTHWQEALLFRRIATVERDCDVGAVDDWEWRGPADLDALGELTNESVVGRAKQLAAKLP
jgi:5'-3' exonuclease